MSIVLIAVILLGVIGGVSAIILYIVAQKFKIVEDVRIDQVEKMLPAANCGGCGYPGCRGFAEACVKADSLDGLNCPVGGDVVMVRVAALLGQKVASSVPMVAVVRCNGSCTNRKRTNVYDGVANCAVESSLYAGDTDCSYGCLGHGDCVVSCAFDAIWMNPETHLPEVIDEKCTACGACVKACPKAILELRNKGPHSRRIYVNCISKDKGIIARKACNVACIACSKCQKACPFDAITISNNLAYIDYNMCRLCRKCVDVCPTSAIIELNFPPKKKDEGIVVGSC